MNLVYIFPGYYAGFPDSLRSAQSNCGCPVTVIDHPETFGVWGETISKLSQHCDADWQRFAIARWVLLRELIQSGKVKLPVFCSDWDILFFSNLNESMRPFVNFDYCASITHDEGVPLSSAAYCVNTIEPLNHFCDLIDSIYRNSIPRPEMTDMSAWSEVTNSKKFTVGDLFSIQNNSVFDHNISCGIDRFQMHNPDARIAFRTKKIVWVDRSPFFMRLDKSLIKAHTIHCWGPFKGKTGRLCKTAGI